MSVEKIKVRREWIGAPDSTIANPNVWLFVASMGGFAAACAGYLTGALPAAATVAINAVAIYWGFTVMHDSMHGTAHADKTVNRVLGEIPAMLLTIPQTIFRAVHYEHHSHTNDPERDPDHFIAGTPHWLLPIKSLRVFIDYRRHYYGRELWRSRAERRTALLCDAAIVSVIVASIATGNIATLLVLWIVPVVFAGGFLITFFDYFPHYPYDNADRYFDTRIYPGKVGNAILLGQNYHLIHHLWTTIPWYRYIKVFAEIEPELRARDARIGPMFGDPGELPEAAEALAHR